MTAAAGARQARIDTAHLTAVAAAASPHGQVRTLAYLLGLRPALSSGTCSRLAAAADREPTWADAYALLVRRGIRPAVAEAATNLLWGDR